MPPKTDVNADEASMDMEEQKQADADHARKKRRQHKQQNDMHILHDVKRIRQRHFPDFTDYEWNVQTSYGLSPLSQMLYTRLMNHKEEGPALTKGDFDVLRWLIRGQSEPVPVNAE